MANYYSTVTASELVPCSKEEFDELEKLLADGQDSPDHGLALEFSETKGVYLYSEDGFFDDSEIPEAFLTRLGEFIDRSGEEYLELGAAYSCDRVRPDSHGGTNFRIYSDGQLIYPEQIYEHVAVDLQGKHDEWKRFRDDSTIVEWPAFPRHEWQLEAYDGDTQLGYWDWVWHKIEAEHNNPSTEDSDAP